MTWLKKRWEKTSFLTTQKNVILSELLFFLQVWWIFSRVGAEFIQKVSKWPFIASLSKTNIINLMKRPNSNKVMNLMPRSEKKTTDPNFQSRIPRTMLWLQAMMIMSPRSLDRRDGRCSLMTAPPIRGEARLSSTTTTTTCQMLLESRLTTSLATTIVMAPLPPQPPTTTPQMENRDGNFRMEV